MAGQNGICQLYACLEAKALENSAICHSLVFLVDGTRFKMFEKFILRPKRLDTKDAGTRFVRQNREIARYLEKIQHSRLRADAFRVNSTQSLRIRTLESEVSRLLSENIALREQVIKLQFDIENNVGVESISSVKGRLEAKLVEFGELVQELGSLQQSAKDRRASRRRSGAKKSPKKSPDQRNWKNALSISEVMGGSEGRLPPIVEGKYYPRRTLDADEMLELLPTAGDSADSPDLGPPPIAHFEAGDPIRFETIQQESPGKAKPEPGGVLNPALLANLETRRKRRGSSQLGENITTESIDSLKGQQEVIHGQPKTENILKSGAKRKFSARDDEQSESSNAAERNVSQFNPTQKIPGEDGVVTLQSSVASAGERSGSSLPDPMKSKDKSRERSRATTSLAPNSRSVLAPKSVNTDPVSSPTKKNRPIDSEKAGPTKPDLSQSRERSRIRNQPASQRFARPTKAPQVEPHEPKPTEHSAQLPPHSAPKMPALPSTDTFPPDGSEPLAPRLEGRDTPPPSDLDPETANTNSFGSLGRASRRQRGSVSYVQPNLRDKMRRPTKELVDAVGAHEKTKEKKAVKTEAEPIDLDTLATGEAPSKVRTVVIKKEITADDGAEWKMLPTKGNENGRDNVSVEAASPPGNKAAAGKADLPASVATDRRRRPSVLDRERVAAEGRTQDSGSGAAIAALLTEKSNTKTREYNVRAEQAKETSKPTETSYIGNGAENVLAYGGENKPAVARSSRRHSSISDDRVKDALARRAERRKDVANNETRELRGAADLKPARSAAALAVESTDSVQGRGERAASRRRSMML
ncbi:MAG: hypothetical protein Q9219_001952 [cf. Caloplaca sp. 3 TL-2023]